MNPGAIRAEIAVAEIIAKNKDNVRRGRWLSGHARSKRCRERAEEGAPIKHA